MKAKARLAALFSNSGTGRDRSRAFAGRGARRGGKGSGALASASALAVGMFLVFAPTASATVVHFREPQASFPFAEPHSPDGLAIDQTNHFVYLATQRNTILKYDMFGQPANFSSISSPTLPAGEFLQQMAVDGSGNIYSVDGYPGAINKYLPSGAPDPTNPVIGAGAVHQPQAIAVNPAGDIFVNNGNANSQQNGEGLPFVEVLGPTGTFKRKFGESEFNELNPRGIAIDSTGVVYVAAGSGGGPQPPFGGFVPKEGGLFAFHENGTCLNSCNPLVKGDILSVAVEPGTDRIYVMVQSAPSDMITEYESSAHGNTELGSFTAPDVTANAPTIAVDGASGRVYVGDLYGGEHEEGHIAVFGPSIIVPTLGSSPVTNVLQTSAVLNGTVNTAGNTAATALTDCHFEYVTAAAYKKTGFTNLSSGGEKECVPAPGSFPNDGAVHPVSAAISGLTSGTAYRFQLVAANENDEGELARVNVGEAFTTAAAPSVDVQGAENLGAAGATLHAKVNPFVFDTSVHFEYLTEADFQANGKSFTGAHTPTSTGAQDIGTGVGDKPAEQVISGLQPETTYHFRAVATNSAGTGDGPDQTFTTLPPALVDVLAPTGISTEAATLDAYLNPGGAATTYKFEYGPDTSYGTTTPSSSAGSGSSPALGSTAISGLKPNTTYHFRTVATNVHGTVNGPDSTFTTLPTSCPNEATRTGLSERLPDCRAYEQVTPVEKIGNQGVVTAINAEGTRAILQLLGNGLPGAPSAPGINTNMNERGPDGWTSVGVDAPARTNKFPWIIWATNSDLSEIVGGVYNGVNNEESVQLAESASATLRHQDGVLEEFEFKSVDGNPLRNGGPPALVASTPDLSDLLYSSNQQLLASDPQPSGPQRWYELIGFGGPSPHLRLASVQDNGTPLTETSCVFGVSILGEGSHAISDDGSKVFFEDHQKTSDGECNVTFIARVNGTKTIDLTDPAVNDECTTSACVNSPGEAAGATANSADGTKFFFESAQQLTDNATEIDSAPREDPIRHRLVTDSHGESETMCKEVEWQTLRRVNGCNLYMYDFNRPEGHNIVPITAERDMSGLGPQVHDVIRASPDGSHVYFVSGGVLTPQPNALGQQAVPSAENVYGYDTETEEMKFVAQVCSARAEKPGGSSGPFGEIISGVPLDPACTFPGEDESTQSIEFSRLRYHSDVTPDGRYLVFASYARLVPDDTNEARDIYRYDFETGSLTRLSVGHKGEDENGNGGGQDANVGASSGLLRGAENHVISDDGETVIFTTARPLQSTDTSENEEIYEWHQGEVSLLSGGEDPTESELPSITPSGRDVFFNTTQGLLPQDVDHIYDAYDARIGGGFPPATPPQPPCGSGEACHGAPPGEPAAPAVGTETFVGPPNPTPHHKKPKPHHKKHKHHKKKKRAGHNHGGAK